jgi:hypothetical protein
VLKKSFWGDAQNFSEPLMPFARGDMRDHIVSHKNDYGASYGRYAVLQWWSRLKISFCEIFGVIRFSTFATLSANSGHDALTWHWPLVPLLDRSKVGPSSASRGPSQPDRHGGEGHGQSSARYVPSFSIYKQRLQLNCHHDNGCAHHCSYADIEAS